MNKGHQRQPSNSSIEETTLKNSYNRIQFISIVGTSFNNKP